jgi:hypothetical protein
MKIKEWSLAIQLNEAMVPFPERAGQSVIDKQYFTSFREERSGMVITDLILFRLSVGITAMSGERTSLFWLITNLKRRHRGAGSDLGRVDRSNLTRTWRRAEQ